MKGAGLTGESEAFRFGMCLMCGPSINTSPAKILAFYDLIRNANFRVSSSRFAICSFYHLEIFLSALMSFLNVSIMFENLIIFPSCSAFPV